MTATDCTSDSNQLSLQSDLEIQNDPLWSIITQQKSLIRDLESTVTRLTKERDSLLLRTSTSPATPPLTCPQEPVPPPRSPYRQHQQHRTHNGTTSDVEATTSTRRTCSSDTLKTGPIHAILDKDAELFANYQKTNKTLTPSSSLLSGVNDKDEETDNQDENATSTIDPLVPPPQQSSDTHVMTPLDLDTTNYASFCTTMELKVVEINVQLSMKNKEPISFIISVSRILDSGVKSNQELWRMKKGYSEFMALDTLLRSHLRSLSSKNDTTNVKMGKLPAKSLFTTTKSGNINMDQKKRMVEKYLTNAIRLPLPETIDLIQFLSSGVLGPKEQSSALKQATCEKEGYVSLYGKQSKKWHSYYFMLRGSTLDYYDSHGGPFIGSILLKNSQMTARRSATPGLFYHSTPRSTMTITQRKRSPSASKDSQQQYNLRMASDSELDEWVQALSHVTQPTPQVSQSECIGTSAKTNLTSLKSDPQLSSRKRISNRILPSTKHSPPQRSQSDNSVHSVSLMPSITTTIDGHRTMAQQQRQRKRSSIDAIFYSTRRTIRDSHPIPQETHSTRQTPSIAALLPSASTSILTRRSGNDATGSKKAATKLNRRTFWPKSMFLGQGHDTNGLRSFLNRHSSTDNLSSVACAPGPSSTTTCRTTIVNQSPSDQHLDASLTKMPGNPIFGVTLEKALLVSKTHGLPTIVYRCIQFLERKKAIYEEGIYRISGSTIKIKGLRKRFDEQGDIDLLALEEFRDCDIHAVSGLLKLWLRELPGHILTDNLIDSFILVKDSVDRNECINKLNHLIGKLPSANYILLRALMAHLHCVTRNANVNKMTLRNMGIVFSPTLGIPTTIFDLFLCEFDTLFMSRRKQQPHPSSANRDSKHMQTVVDHPSDDTKDRATTLSTKLDNRPLTAPKSSSFGTSRMNRQSGIDQDDGVVLDRHRPMIKT